MRGSRVGAVSRRNCSVSMFDKGFVQDSFLGMASAAKLLSYVSALPGQDGGS